MRKKKITSEWYGDEVEMVNESDSGENSEISDELLEMYMKENSGDNSVEKKDETPEEAVSVSPELQKEYIAEHQNEDEDNEPKQIKGEFIGIIGLILGAAAILSCLVMRVAHFPFVGILSLIGLAVNVFCILTGRARVLSLFGVILSAAGLGMVAMVVLKLLRLM